MIDTYTSPPSQSLQVASLSEIFLAAALDCSPLSWTEDSENLLAGPLKLMLAQLAMLAYRRWGAPTPYNPLLLTPHHR